MHSEDQRRHHTYKNIWQNIGQYATENGIDTWNELTKSLSPIQDKIDPARAFSQKYSLNAADLHNDISFALKEKLNISEKITPETWEKITETINQNHMHFPLNYASEYPSFMMERIAESWNASERKGKGNTLDRAQAQLLHSMLNNIDNAYPATTHEKFNSHIQKRKKSIEEVYFQDHFNDEQHDDSIEKINSLLHKASPPKKPLNPGEKIVIEKKKVAEKVKILKQK